MANRPAVNAALKELEAYRTGSAAKSLRDAFATDPERFETLSFKLDDLLLDLSRLSLDAGGLGRLLALASAADVEGLRDAMFAGDAINLTEHRGVLHTALRNRSGRPVMLGGQDVMPAVLDVLARMSAFAQGIRNGTIASTSGGHFTDIVNIGIGGSDLGPAMATAALRPYHDGPRLHFVSNVDGAHIADTLATLDPGTTLVIIASKTFTTIETMTNAATARRWLAAGLGEAAVGQHCAAISTATDKVMAFGIAEERMFGFWDWVGGRYSVWSAIGLPVMIAIGAERFAQFLAGAHAMDEHFRTAPAATNLPMLLGLAGIWHRLVCGYPSRAIIPYDQRLARLPAYLQQLDMESNGKRVDRSGTPLAHPSGPVVWGEPGTNGQHAFFQLLHQGSDVVPVEFIIAALGHEADLAHQHDLLVANCLAQAEALARGRTLDETKVQMQAAGASEASIAAIAPHRVFPGNRPSILIAYGKLDPYALGRLIALYEHRVFVEAAIFDINAFDQWGVELGKELAASLLPAVQGDADAGSVAGALAHMKMLRAAKGR